MPLTECWQWNREKPSHSCSPINFFSKVALLHKACFYTLHYKLILMPIISILGQPGTVLSNHVGSDHIASATYLQRDQGTLKLEEICKDNDT